MPDNDIVPRGVRKHWRPAIRLFLGGHEASVVAAAAERALAATVRDSGLPPTAPFISGVQKSIGAYSTPAYESAQREYLWRAGGNQLAHEVVSVVRAMHESERQVLMAWSSEELGNEVAARALRRCARRSLVGSEEVWDRLMRSGHSLATVEQREQVCLDALRYGDIARQIEAGNGKSVRSPARQKRVRDLRAFLQQEVS